MPLVMNSSPTVVNNIAMIRFFFNVIQTTSHEINRPTK
jgi:hypothetical protein